MPGIVVAQNFNNASLPAGESLASSILADNHVINWFQADPNYVTLAGTDIISFTDRKGTANKLTRVSSATGATLTENLFSQYTGARFNAAESDQYLMSGTAQDLTQPFTWSGVATLRTLAATGTLMGTFSSSSVRAIVSVTISGANAGRLSFLYGSASCFGHVLGLDEPFAFACGFDGVNVFLMSDGIRSSLAASGSPSATAFSVGALPGKSLFWDGDVSDIFLCDVAVNSSAGASLLTKLTAFYEDVYGLTL